MTNKVIRWHLSKYVPKNKNDMFSSKYLRIVYITEMASCQGVDFLDSHACSGNSLCTNQESYLDQNILSLTFTDVYALDGWVDKTPKKSYPMFHCCGPHVMEQAHWLIKLLYTVSLPQFKWNDSLYPVLLTETDSMEMYHHYVGTHIGHEKYLYTKMCKSSKNPKSTSSTVLGTIH